MPGRFNRPSKKIKVHESGTFVCSGVDWLECGNAYALASRIRDYWMSRNKRVTTRIEQSGSSLGPLFCVRSDMKGGKPS